MDTLTQKIWFITNTDLIETMNGNSDVQLRFKKNDGFYMVSPTTGNHFVKSNKLNNRVIAHWQGFKANQK